MNRRWFVGRPQPQARSLLVALPHAGGSAGAYRGWQAWLGDRVEVRAVQYPGHASRFIEPLGTDCRALAGDIAAGLLPLARPLTLFGHSLGAIIAFEVAAALEQQHGVATDRLVVSGSLPPDVPSRDPISSTLSDDEIVASLRDTDAVSQALLEPELRQLLLPVLRSDLRMGEAYRPAPARPIRAPIVAFGGDADPLVALSDLDGWGRHTTGRFHRVGFAGGHFYLHNISTKSVLSELEFLCEASWSRVSVGTLRTR